jgi:NADPH:quinone reductase-like Zn-dependent oxidoreductase
MEMKAVTFKKYGPPSVLQLAEVPAPEIGDDEVLIKIVTTSVNSGDWRVRKAEPFMVRLFFGLFSPKLNILGTTFSGSIEKVGKNVQNFKSGDQVMGQSEDKMGTYAEYLNLPAEGKIALRPEKLSNEDAAAIIFGGHTALHFLRKAEINEGDKVLVYGASGSVGAAAVQIAKYLGAEVTGVCSSANVDFVKSIGADHIIDYRKTDINTISEKFDVVVETVGKTKVKDTAKLVKSGGKLVLIASMLEGMIQGPFVASRNKIKVIDGVAKANADDIALLGKLTADGVLKSTIDKVYKLEEMAEAHQYVEKGHKKGNVIVKLH